MTFFNPESRSDILFLKTTLYLEQTWFSDSKQRGITIDRIKRILKINVKNKLMIKFDLRFDLYNTVSILVDECSTEKMPKNKNKNQILNEMFKLIFPTCTDPKSKSTLLHHKLNAELNTIVSAMNGDPDKYSKVLKKFERRIYKTPEFASLVWQRYNQALLKIGNLSKKKIVDESDKNEIRAEREVSEVLYGLGLRREEKPCVLVAKKKSKVLKSEKNLKNMKKVGKRPRGGDNVGFVTGKDEICGDLKLEKSKLKKKSKVTKSETTTTTTTKTKTIETRFDVPPPPPSLGPGTRWFY